MAFVVGLRKVKYLQRPKEPRILLAQAFFPLVLCPPVRETLQWGPSQAREGKGQRVGDVPYKAVPLLTAQAQPPLTS